MAESNVFSSSLSVGSETLFDIVCQPCSSEGRNAEAEGYCQDCCEHLCAQCISYHKKFSMSKHHTLVDKENMPNQQDPPPVKDVCTEICQNHREDIIKYFCPAHKVLGCTACITLKHTVCKDVAYIPEVVADIENSQDYKEFKTKLEDLIQKSKDTAEFSHDSKKRSSDCLSKAIHDIDAYRQEVIQAIDNKVSELKERARQINTQDTDKMNALADGNTQVLTELQSVLSEFSTLLDNKQYCKLFIEMKRKQENLPELEEKLKEIERAEVSEYKFEHDDDFQTTLGRESMIGKLVMKNTAKSRSTAKRMSQSELKPVAAARDIHQIKATHMADINAKSGSNTLSYHILSGLALLSKGKLVAADWNNGTLKLIDTTHNKIISEHKPENNPWDVTLCGDNIAATLPTSKKILFMKYNNGLVHDRDIRVGGQCRGIDYCDNKLFVIFDKEKKLEIMTTTGVVLQRIETNEQGGRLFEDPTYVTVSETNKSIYVSEYAKGQLTSLDMDGKLKGVYEDSELGRPRQLAADKAGVMYLCDFKNDTVHMLSPQCTQVKIFLTERDGLTRPWSVCYCENTGRLYVGSHTIKVYQVC